MAYSDFTLKRAQADFDLIMVETEPLFRDIPTARLSDSLVSDLAKNVPLALAINTEKARSELIIIDVLLEVRRHLDERIGLFSGINFNVDPERSLTGICDYLLSRTPEQFFLRAPVVAIVEAKNENIVGGLGQCVAEMVAAQTFNAQEGQPADTIYGAVTSGNTWKFLKLDGTTVSIDRDEYYIDRADKIVGILVAMMTTANGQ